MPSDWRKAIIIPILKDPSSDKRTPLNYRGISLLSCISKVYSALVNKRLTCYLEEYNLLADEQNGFRKDRSCEDHIFTLNSIVKNNANVFTAYIDLKKAFDFVDRDLMLYKLLLLGVDGNIYNSIKSVYKHTTSTIKINNKLTEWFNCNSGVAQGNNLSPTIFAAFVNDLVTEINDLGIGVQVGDLFVSMLLYADDIVLIANSERNLQTMLNTLHGWCKKWRVLINTSKSKCMHFRRPRTRQTDFRFQVGDNVLETVSEYRYLGVIIADKGNFVSHAEALSRGAGRALGSLIHKISGLKDFGFKSYEKLFNSCIVPIMDYCSSIWGYKHYQASDNVQHRAIRYFLGVHRFAPTAAISGDVGWLPAQSRRRLNMLRLWNRLIIMDSDRITKRVFESEYNNPRTNNWCNEIKSIMDDLQLSAHYNSKSTVDLQSARLLICNVHNVRWARSLQSSPKLRTYRSFKDTLEVEKYVTLNFSKHERSTMAQFRCGILPLRIETGRYVNEPLDERLCTMCDAGQIESEIHFLLDCKLYDEIRRDIYLNLLGENTFSSKTPLEKLKYLLNECTRKTAKFLVKAYALSRSRLYSRV